MNAFVFISYSHSDKPFVLKFASRLRKAEIGFFMDTENIAWGEEIPKIVKEALVRATHLVVMISPGSEQSAWVSYEVGYAHGREVILIPYLLHPAMKVPGFLANIRYVTRKEESGLIESLQTFRSPPIRSTLDLQSSQQLIEATRIGNPDLVKDLVRQGVNPNVVVDEKLNTLLHIAVENRDLLIARILINNGANPDVRGSERQSPLHRAAENGDVKMAELLIDSGTPVDIRGHERRTPLHMAVAKGNFDMVHFLLKRGADINAGFDENEWRSEWTALHESSTKLQREITQFLLRNGAIVDAIDKSGLTPLYCVLVSVDEESHTLQGHIEMMRLLLDAGANIEALNEHRETLLQSAVSTLVHDANYRDGYPGTYVLIEAIRLFLERGAEMDVQDHDGLSLKDIVSNIREEDKYIFEARRIFVKYGWTPSF